MSSRFPLLPILKLANLSVTARGFSLLATHTYLRGNIFLCHNPTYLFAELLGLKKPNSKIWPGETRVCPCVNGCEGVMLYTEEAQYCEGNKLKMNKKNKEIIPNSIPIPIVSQKKQCSLYFVSQGELCK
jgi:hypothetical protein